MKIKHNSSLKNVSLLAAFVIGACTYTANASIIVSDNFSFGYGANVYSTQVVNVWTLQTSVLNTPNTIGDFTFTPTVTGNAYSAAGPTFTDRVLTSAASGTPVVGGSSTFNVTVNALWSGDLDSIQPGLALEDMRLRLVITEIRIYGLQYSAASDPSYTLAFRETTSGFASTATPITLNRVLSNSTDNLRTAANYTNVSYTNVNWSALEGYYVDGAISGQRTFDLVIGGGTNAAIDGFEIFGYIEVMAIPEPAALGLLLGSGGFLLAWNRRRRLA